MKYIYVFISAIYYAPTYNRESQNWEWKRATFFLSAHTFFTWLNWKNAPCSIGDLTNEKTESEKYYFNMNEKTQGF